jgi:hypothetical protein
MRNGQDRSLQDAFQLFNKLVQRFFRGGVQPAGLGAVGVLDEDAGAVFGEQQLIQGVADDGVIILFKLAANLILGIDLKIIS